jgi:hypothetical protein
MQQPPSQLTSTAALTSKSIPVILVQDYTQQPTITTKYIHGPNDLDFQTIYTRIKSLLIYPFCPHDTTWPCPPCSTSFLSIYWTSAAHLLDYLADFLRHDTTLMQSIWFHLLDIWQESSSFFPYDAVLENEDTSPKGVQAFSKARWFLSDYEATLALMNATMFGVRADAVPRERIVHPPSGDLSCPVGEYNTGPYVSGLKPWEEWLCEGAPGVAAPSSSLVDDGRVVVRHVPMAAIAIIKTHTQRARRLAARLNPDTEFVNAFDQNSLCFPEKVDTQRHTYRSLTGRSVSYHLANGAPPIFRYQGYGDPSMLCSAQTFTLLDECVGVCKGVESYEPVSGEVRDNGENEDEECDDEDVFDMWVVHQSIEAEEGGERNNLAKGWEDMFDTGCTSDEF